jgi:hypothetical protein
MSVESVLCHIGNAGHLEAGLSDNSKKRGALIMMQTYASCLQSDNSKKRMNGVLSARFFWVMQLHREALWS